MTNYNVITAGPSSGKTSTINEISARGYKTLPESARLFINQKISEGEDPEEIREKYDFQDNLIRIDRNIEENNLRSESVFMDRSLADNIAYIRHKNDVENFDMEDLKEECRNKYDNVFLLERLNFEEDVARSEDEKEAQKLHSEIRQAYLDLGYKVQEIPVVPVNQRVDMILDKI
jgi:predicted ATPase